MSARSPPNLRTLDIILTINMVFLVLRTSGQTGRRTERLLLYRHHASHSVAYGRAITSAKLTCNVIYSNFELTASGRDNQLDFICIQVQDVVPRFTGVRAAIERGGHVMQDEGVDHDGLAVLAYRIRRLYVD